MKKFLSVVLALAMTLSLVVVGASATDFTDKTSIKNTEAVTVMNKLGIISGYANGSFNPTGSITRGAAAKILCMVKLGSSTASKLSCETAPFKDVAKNSTFAPYIAYCVNTGIVSGYADKTFKPASTVTGYAFAKMLLVALGVDGTYTGTGWEINVAAAGQKVGLFDGIASDVVYSKALSRDNACQMALNAMLYSKNTTTSTTTKYVVKDTAGNQIFDTYAEAAAYLKANQTSSYEGAITVTQNVAEDSLGYTVYGLVQGTSKDVFGRPTTTYTATGWTSTLSFAKTPVLTYKGSVKLTTLYTALGLSADTAITAQYNNGGAVSVQTIAKATTLVTGSGNGSVTEVYKDSKGKLTVVNIETYAATVSKVTAATAETETAAATDRTVTLKSATSDINGKTFATTSFAKDDVVLVTYSTSTGTPVVQSVTAATKVTGQVTKTTSAGVYTVGGKDYQMSANKTTSATSKVVVGNTVDVYLDAQGNIIDAGTVSTSTTTYYGFALEYSRVAHASATLATAATETSEQVKFVDSTGATKTLSTTAAYTSSTSSNNFVATVFKSGSENTAYAAPNTLFAYTLDSNGKIASVSTAATVLTDASVAAGQKYVTTSAGIQYLTDSTPVFYYDGTNVTVYTGASKVIAKTITTADSYVMNPTAGVASAVLLKVASVTPATASKYVFINTVAKTVATTQTTSGTTTTTTLTDVYLDGVAGTLVVPNTVKDSAGTDLTVKTLYKYTVTDGVATLTKVNPINTTVSLIQSGYFVAGGNVVLTGTATKYYQINSDGTVEVATSLPALSSLDTGTHLNIVHTDGDSSTTANVVYFTIATIA